MIGFLILHVSAICVILQVAKRALSVRRNIPTRIKLRHYTFLTFLVFMNVSGMSHAAWTLGRVLNGDLLSRLRQYFIVLTELPAVLVIAIWLFCVTGRCITAILSLRVARLNEQSRSVLLTMYPLLVVAESAASCITLLGSTGLAFVQSRLTEYVIALCIWCLFAWPYIFAYRFYRSSVSDVLFSES